MTSPIGSVTQSQSNAATPSATSASSSTSSSMLGKDDFMKLLVAQLSNQDPLNPMQGTEFVTQLSQYATLEQSMQQTQQLSLLSTQVTGLSNNEATALVGKQVTTHGSNMAFDGTLATTSDVTLSGAAAKVSVQIQDSSGNTVRTLDLGAQPAGAVPITWDGRTDAGQLAPKGSYSVSVTATDANGAKVTASQDVVGTVTKVAFDKGYPELTLDNGATVAISDLVSVGGVPTTSK